MEAVILLCDAAQVSSGKLYLLGAGWSVTQSPMSPTAIALKIDVPWDEANMPHSYRIHLEDADGKPILVRTSQKMDFHPFEITQVFEVGRAPGLPPGVPIPFTAAIFLGPQILQPGCYRWVLTVDYKEDRVWGAAFTVMGAPQALGSNAT